MSGCIANELTSTSARGSIHGHIHWDNDRHTDFIYARIVNGEERKADFIEFDGERYERVRECERVLYKPTKVLVCSECGAGMPKQLDKYCYLHYCPNCGAKVKVGEC